MAPTDQQGPRIVIWFVVVLVAWPILEIYLTALVASQIGWLAALTLLFALSVLGLLVLRSSTRRARRGIAGSDPRRVAQPSLGAVADTSVQFAAGVLLFIPGFATAAIGLLLLIPPVRTIIIALVGGYTARRIARSEQLSAMATRVRLWTGGDIVAGEVVRPDDEPLPPPSQLPSA